MSRQTKLTNHIFFQLHIVLLFLPLPDQIFFPYLQPARAQLRDVTSTRVQEPEYPFEHFWDDVFEDYFRFFIGIEQFFVLI